MKNEVLAPLCLTDNPLNVANIIHITIEFIINSINLVNFFQAKHAFNFKFGCLSILTGLFLSTFAFACISGSRSLPANGLGCGIS